MLAALVVSPSASAPRVKLLWSATATKIRRLASGARRWAAPVAVRVVARLDTGSVLADRREAELFFRRMASRADIPGYLDSRC
jgi:hypothetical protein